MNKAKLKKAVIGLGIGFSLVAVIILALCLFFGIRSGSDVVAYGRMVGMHPIWKDLALRRIVKGDDVNDVLIKHTPVWEMLYPPYRKMNFQDPFGPGLTIFSKNNKLIYAGVGEDYWGYVFFESPEEDEEHSKVFTAYLEEQRCEREIHSIHKAVLNGDDVFLSESIDCNKVTSREDLNFLEEKLSIETTKVICGHIESGSHITLFSNDHHLPHIDEPNVVFIVTASDDGLEYETASLNALEQYQSFNKEQLNTFLAKQQAKQQEGLVQRERIQKAIEARKK